MVIAIKQYTGHDLNIFLDPFAGKITYVRNQSIEKILFIEYYMDYSGPKRVVKKK